MLTAIVTYPKLGVTSEISLTFPGIEEYSREDIEAFAAKSVTISAQAACRATGEAAYNKHVKDAMPKDATPDVAAKVRREATMKAQSAMVEWANTKARAFMVNRRDEEALAAKKVEKVATAAKSLGKDDAAKVLAALLAANPELAAGLKANKAAKAG